MDKFLNSDGAKKLFRYLFNYINAKFNKGVTSISLSKIYGLSATFNGVYSSLSLSDIVYGGSHIGSNKTKTDIAYEICFTYSESEVLGVYPSITKDAGINKTLTTLDFDPFGNIFYYDAATRANSSISTLYTQYRVDIRYSFNVSSLTTDKHVYVKCSPQANGRVKLDTSQPITLLLPATEDGFVYILLGPAISTTTVLLIANHPIYYYKDGAIRLWTNAPTVDISGKEDNTNKVTSLSSSSTDTQYPSAKCVYDLSNLKLNKIPIVSVASNTSSLSCEEDKYYRLDTAVNTFAITLPAVTDTGIVKSIIIYLTTGATPAVTITSTQQLHYSYGFSLEASKTYEINALWNGAAWVITSIEL